MCLYSDELHFVKNKLALSDPDPKIMETGHSLLPRFLIFVGLYFLMFIFATIMHHKP
jgi:hypothetical protein